MLKKGIILQIKTWFISKYHNNFYSVTYLAKIEEICHPLYNLHYKLNGAYDNKIYSVF